MELGRKPLESMRWEEIWDAALRIRSAFLARPVPPDLVREIEDALTELGEHKAVAVRSSAPGEDSASRSFAGLHESYVGVLGRGAVLDAVRLVWASLWSDAALLYRRELSLDASRSRMAVLVQEVIHRDRSGVAFGRDPRDAALDRAIVEAVAGPCSDLVDGLVDPDRWILKRSSGDVLEWRQGERDEGDKDAPLLGGRDLVTVHRALVRLESLLGWPPDVEWTGRAERFTLLQARPITTAGAEEQDERSWYLTLRPGAERLRQLRERVANELIPELDSLGQCFAEERLESLDDEALACAIEQRRAAVERWREIYRDEFIPFAHGARQLGIYYNDAVRPEDPYEFVGLLQGQEMRASKRNASLADLARLVRQQGPLREAIRQGLASTSGEDYSGHAALGQLRGVPGGDEFARAFRSLLEESMDVAYGEQRLADRPDLLLHTVLEMAQAPKLQSTEATTGESTTEELERRLLDAVGEERQEEARDILATGRLSWRLRDDDNLLVGRLESQLLRAIRIGADRLRAAGRLLGATSVGEDAVSLVAEALLDPGAGPVHITVQRSLDGPDAAAGASARQLVGQPAAPGLATGKARHIVAPEDLAHFRAGEILVCDAIQPTMTHLVPLASAVVERRGGMLIHGAIIARELGIPCVNGIANAVERVRNGEWVTVDGYLGIVTIGPPEFDLEGVSLGSAPHAEIVI
jgi:pyruvate,water dikinase